MVLRYYDPNSGTESQNHFNTNGMTYRFDENGGEVGPDAPNPNGY